MANAPVAGAHTDAGTRYGALNQDEVVVVHSPEGSCMPTLLCVLDGHGLFGERVSRTVKRSLQRQYAELCRDSPLPVCFCGAEEPQGTDSADDESGGWLPWRAAVRGLFDTAHHDALDSYFSWADAPRYYEYGEHKLELNGSDLCSILSYKSHDGFSFLYEAGTCVALALVPSSCERRSCRDECTPNRPCSLFVAASGDCEVVIGGVVDDEVLATTINEKHIVTNETELARLQKHYAGRFVITSDEYFKPVADGSLSFQEIQVTRSLGHRKLAHYGIDHTPDLFRRLLTPEDQYLILATDGIWDYMDGHTAVDIAVEMEDVHSASKTIISEAQGRAEDIDDIDNAACVVMQFPSA